MDHLVYEVLELDEKLRQKLDLNDADLYGFEDLNPNEWDYSLPTLSSGQSIELVSSEAQFIQKFYHKIPFKIKMDNLLMAGGAVAATLCKQSRIKDLDIFFYDLTVEQANQRLDQLVLDLRHAYQRHLRSKQSQAEKDKKIKPSYDFRCIWNKNCVSVIFDDTHVVQIILRIYKTKSQILHGFDMGSCAVGFDGQKLYFTKLSKFAYEYSCNIIDTTHRSTTYEKRLIKYYDRDFDIIMPHFNMAHLRNVNSRYNIEDVCELPYITWSYDNVKGNKILVNQFLTPMGNDDSDYQIENLDQHRIFYINLHNMVWNKEDYYFYVTQSRKVRRAKPYMSRRRVIDFYDNMIEKLTKNNSLNILALKKYIYDSREVLQVLVEKGHIHDKIFLETLRKVINEEKFRILNIIDAQLIKDYPMNWLVENPTTQLTSSFNPILEKTELWYGKYYIEQVISNNPLPDLSKKIPPVETEESDLEIESDFPNESDLEEDPLSVENEMGNITETDDSDIECCKSKKIKGAHKKKKASKKLY